MVSMQIIITNDADEDLGNMDGSMRERFDKHILKIALKRPTRFYKAHNIEQVGDQGRIIYQIERQVGIVYILRCFATHKEYDRWCSSFRGK
jgi:mRNA-degrading endonuclease HigB of HigAB toxin-antitoxin module